MRKRGWIGVIAGSIFVSAVIGCGGGGGDASPIGGGGSGGGGGINLAEQATARVDVNVASGSVKVTPLGSENQTNSLYTGSAISVSSSSLSTDSGELTIKKLKLKVANNTADSIDNVKLILDRVSTEDAGDPDLREFATVDTPIGPGTSGNDGPGSAVTITQPSGIARGSDGSIYVAGQGDGTLRRLKDGFVNRLATGIATPGGVDLMPGADFVFMVEQSTHNLIRLPIDGGSKFVIAGGGTAGFVDGSGSAARFDVPRDLVIVNSAAYICDFNNDKIRKVTNLTGGSGVVTTLNVFPAITRPSGIGAMNLNGVDWLVVVSIQTHKVFLVNSTNGQSFQIAGTGAAGLVNGVGSTAQFNQPSDVAVVGSSLFVADIGNRMIRQIGLKTGADPKFASSWIVKSLAGSGVNGAADGPAITASFGSPRYMAADGSGALYATDLTNNRTRRILPVSGVFPITGTGAGNLPVSVANPDSFVPDPVNQTNRKAVFDLGPLSPAGGANSFREREIEFLIQGDTESFYFFVSLTGGGTSIGALDAVLNTAAPFRGSPNVNVRTLAGTSVGSADGDATVARYGTTMRCCAAGTGVYVCDNFNSNIRRYDTVTGTTRTILGGNGNAPGSLAGGVGLTTTIPHPEGIWMNESETEGFIGTDKCVIRISRGAFTDPMNPGSWFASIIAGVPGATGMTNGQGDVARFGQCSGLVADSTNSVIYAADRLNHQIRTLRNLGGNDRDAPTSWRVDILAGSPAGTPGDADGANIAATFRSPVALALAKDGNLYIAEDGGNRIRRMTPNTQVSLLAGSSTAVSGMVDDTGSLARFNVPNGVTLDNAGYLYVSEGGSLVVRRVSTLTQEVRTVAGFSNGGPGIDGPGNTAVIAPTSLSFRPGIGIYVADFGRIVLIERTIRSGAP
jgi:sugar lactone lactonase YvrE